MSRNRHKAYNILSREFVNHTINSSIGRVFLDWSRDTFSPDEFVWATLTRRPSFPGARPPSLKWDVNEMQSRARLVKDQFLKTFQVQFIF